MADSVPLAAVSRGATPPSRAARTRREATSAADGLVAAAKAGDESAFAALYLDTQPRLLRYAAGLVGQDAEEVTAEAWLQITRDLNRFTGDLDAFRGWASRIVRNRAIDSARARARRPVQATDLTALLDRPDGQDTRDAGLRQPRHLERDRAHRHAAPRPGRGSAAARRGRAGCRRGRQGAR